MNNKFLFGEVVRLGFREEVGCEEYGGSVRGIWVGMFFVLGRIEFGRLDTWLRVFY